MAETDSLDDFFAKKDKSKKGKAKLTPEDLLAQQSSEKKKKKKQKNNTENNSTKKPVEDDEWNAFEDEKEVDLTGLRVGKLQVKDDDDDKKDRADGDGDNDGRDKKEGGPWKMPVSAPSEPESVPKREESPPPPPKPKETPKTTGKYVPPSKRAAMAAQEAQTASASVSAVRRKPRTAPNLRSEDDFPTLGSVAKQPGEEVIEKSKSTPAWGGHHTAPLPVGNKYSALNDD